MGVLVKGFCDMGCGANGLLICQPTTRAELYEKTCRTRERRYQGYPWEEMRRRQASFNRHLYWEIAYDLTQISVLVWLMSQVKLKDKHFEYKICIDFINLVTTFIDLVLIKGATVAITTGCDPAKMKVELESELKTLE